MSLAAFFAICLLVSAVTIRMAMSTARHIGVMDHPGGHKQHDTSTPFVGGVGVMTALICALFLMQIYYPSAWTTTLYGIVAINAGTIFLTGLADDMWQLHFKTRFLLQTAVALSMAFLGGVVLGDLGSLFPGHRLGLGPLAVPFTVFATIGVINALNMIDGIDGLSGSISLVCLVLTGMVALMAGNQVNFTLIVALIGGVAGFLYFNLRYPTNVRARVFLGDNGSMLLGYLFARLFIDLSQGPHRAMPPVTALWLFAVPLMDTVGVMLRRVWLSKSPFRADRTHLHHLFLRAGFRVFDTVIILAMIQLLLGLVGIAGLWLGVPEWLMFAAFLLSFAGYFHIVARPWRFVPWLRQLNDGLGLPSAQARGIHIGYLRRTDTHKLVDVLERELGDRYEYHLSLHEVDSETRDGPTVYGILVISFDHDDATIGETKRVMDRLNALVAVWFGLQTHQFVQRNPENDRRSVDWPINARGSRQSERRVLGNKTLLQTLRHEPAKQPHPKAMPA